MGDDFKSGVEGIVTLDQVQRRLAAAEQLHEQPLEMAVDDFEGGQEPLARLAVEALDTLAQPLDGFHQIVTLRRERSVLRFDLAQLFLCAQIVATEPLPT